MIFLGEFHEIFVYFASISSNKIVYRMPFSADELIKQTCLNIFIPDFANFIWIIMSMLIDLRTLSSVSTEKK